MSDEPRAGVEIERRHLLNAQTGRIGWEELQRHFARGVVIRVAEDMDLVQVAARVAADDVDQVRRWLADGSVRRAVTEDARAWHSRKAGFWAVVSAPWVLVQEAREGD